MDENLKILTWKQVRNDIETIDPILVKLIDNINPDDEYIIYKLEYPWGKHLVREGTLYLPNIQGDWVKLDDPSIDPKIKEDLSYGVSMPLGMVLKNSIELYLEALGRVIPFVFMPTGKFFGLWISLQQDKTSSNHIGRTSNIVSGSRSTLLLPKISDAIAFKKLKKIFGLQCRVPETLNDQWPLLLELAEHKDFPQKWTAEVIYFSKKWLEPRKDISWKLFKNYFLEKAWEDSTYLRNQIIFDLAFSCALEEKNLKPNPYLTDTVKHLFAISQDSYPGYEVAIDNTTVPLEAFQKIFLEVYGLKYQPTIMIPGYLKSDHEKSLYYSLEVPTLMAFSPKSRKITNKLEDLREIKHIIQRITDYLREDKLRLQQTPLYRLINEINFEYYHTDKDIYHETAKTSELQKIDKYIIQEKKKYKQKEFCETSPFLRGCIRISKKI